MNLLKERILMIAFFNSQFIVPFCGCFIVVLIISKINRLHKRCLRIIYSDKQPSNEALLEKDASFSIHNRNLQILATKMRKVIKGLSSPINTELFKPRDEQHYNLRNNAEFTILVIRTAYHGSEIILFLCPKIWNALPDRLISANSPEIFKSEIKKWKPENCPCRLCRLRVQMSVLLEKTWKGKNNRFLCDFLLCFIWFLWFLSRI